MKHIFIVNPAAGHGLAEKTYLPQILSFCKDSELEYEIHRSLNKQEIGTYIKQRAAVGDDIRFYAIGGDGTLCDVVNGAMGFPNAEVAVLPSGTGNDFIKSVGIPNDPRRALDILLTCAPQPTDTGEVNGEFFLNVCGTGFDVTVLDYAEAEKAKHRGLTPYLLGLVKANFHYRSVRLKITDETGVTEGRFLVCSVANGRFIGGGIPICPAADPSDGLLDLVLVRHVPRRRIPLYLPGLMMGRDLNFRITTHRRVRSVTFEGEKLRVNIDGEIRTMDGAEFRIRPGSLRLIRPPAERN